MSEPTPAALLAGHTFGAWRYRGMGNSDRLCATCLYLQQDMQPDDEVPPCPKPAKRSEWTCEGHGCGHCPVCREHAKRSEVSDV